MKKGLLSCMPEFGYVYESIMEFPYGIITNRDRTAYTLVILRRQRPRKLPNRKQAKHTIMRRYVVSSLEECKAAIEVFKGAAAQIELKVEQDIAREYGYKPEQLHRPTSRRTLRRC
jgi:hypothetical protein